MNMAAKLENDKNIRYLNVGWVKDAQGLRGELFVRLQAETADWLDKLTVVRLVSSTSVVKSFPLESARPHKNGLIVKVTGLSDRTSAEALKGYSFEIPESILISEPGEGLYLNEILGFEVLDVSLGFLGTIKGFASNGPQDLLLVDYKNREVMIPFVQAFVQKMDFKGRKIHVDLPEGLLE